MTDVTQNSHIQRTIIRLLNHYSFDSEQRPMPFVVANWIGYYPLQWIVSAIVEALYQGRYKTISVEQILIIWQRRGRPLHHFNGEFERIVCGQLMGVASDAHQEDTAEHLAVLAQVNKERHGVTHQGPYMLEQQGTQTPLPHLGNTHDVGDRIDHDCMGHDGRLSEMLGEEALSATDVDRAAEPSQTCSPQILLDMAKHAISLKQRDPEGHKIPVAVFEPVDRTSQTLEWQQLTGSPIRHHPIHQFTPLKASSTMHNKLKAIAHNNR